MQTKRTNHSLKGKQNSINENEQKQSEQIVQIDPQIKPSPVKQKRYRRKFNKADKLKMLEAYDACTTPSERGLLLRKEGLYYATISKWRIQMSDKKSNNINTKAYKMQLSHNKIMRENGALKKKLAQAEAIIDLQKKVSELLSGHILTPEMSEISS